MAIVTRYYIGEANGLWYPIMDKLTGRKLYETCGKQAAEKVVERLNKALSD